jgi:hypothetical protein
MTQFGNIANPDWLYSELRSVRTPRTLTSLHFKLVSFPSYLRSRSRFRSNPDVDIGHTVAELPQLCCCFLTSVLAMSIH